MPREAIGPLPGETNSDALPDANAQRGTAPGRRIPRAVWLIVALHVLIMSAYTVLVPLYRGPDEPEHVDMVLALQHGFHYPQLGTRYLSDQVVQSMGFVHYAELQAPHLTTDQAGGRASRLPFARLAPNQPSTHQNQLTQHPPLFYWLQTATSGAITSVSGGHDAWPYDRFVALLRLTDVLLMAPLPLLAYAVARRFGCNEHTSLAAAIFLLTIPELSHIGATVNNDNLLTLLFAVLTLLLAWVMTGDLSTRTALSVGIVAGLALLTKGFALLLPVWILIAYLVARRRYGNTRQITMRLSIAFGTALVIGGWWWIRNLIVYGSVQPTIDSSTPHKIVHAPKGTFAHAWWWIQPFASAFVRRFWSWIGGYGGQLPLSILVLMTLVVTASLIVAVARAEDWRRRAEFGVLIFPMVAIAVLLLPRAYSFYARTGLNLSYIQGRYLFPGVVGLSVVVAIGLARMLGRRVAVLPWLMMVAVAITQGFALWRIMRSFWGPEGSPLIGLFRAALAWSPWNPSVIVGCGVLTIAVAALTVFELRPNAPSGSLVKH